MKVLCICPIGIGNYILFYPACSLIKKNNPDIELYLLGLRIYISDLASNDCLWSGIYLNDPTRIKRDIVTQIKMINNLRKEHFDASIAFFPANKWQYNLLPFLSAIPVRYGFKYSFDPVSNLSMLLTNRLPVNADIHDLYQNITMAYFFLNKEYSECQIEFPVIFGSIEEQWAEKYFAGNNSSFKVAVHPGSSEEHGMDAKRWDAEKFAFLADRLCEKYSGEIYIFGGSEELVLKKRIASAMKQRCHIVEPVSLRKTAAMLSKCNICICNDSGLMHISAVSGVPTVAIFGPTDEKRNGPVGPKTLVIRKSMEGFPLWKSVNVGNRKVPKNVDPQASLKALSAQYAWEKTESWLESSDVL